MQVWYVLTGFFGGLLGGMGMGGGTLLIPMLSLFFSLSQKQAQAVNLIAFLPMAAVALAVHTKNGLVRYKTALPMLFSGVVFSVLGSPLALGSVGSGISAFVPPISRSILTAACCCMVSVMWL